jgi:16S rRNA (cytosine967-C5)-methyltransferase
MILSWASIFCDGASALNTSPNLRLLAARIIDEVTDGRSLSDCLESSLKLVNDPRDRAFVQAICYGVCRYYTRLDILLSHLFTKPMKAKDSDVHALLLVGLYQLMEMRVPPHAAVAETVNAAEKLKKPWARGLINAILREYLRSREKREQQIQSDPESHYAHPSWWIHAIKTAWPDQWQDILVANNAHPPFALRVNQRQLTRDHYVEKCQAKGLQLTIISETQSGLMLASPMSAEALPGFFAGDISVQDGAAQLACELLMLSPNLRVLDACAAPGGKLSHMLELEPNLAACVAVEKNSVRMPAIKDNLTRLSLQAQCIHADVNEVQDWWDGQLFDRILLDAPCSASGVIRRHPDIKLLRQPSDIPTLASEQLRLLESLWPLLKPGGLLLYATCSIFPEENVQVLQHFFAMHPDAKEEKIALSWGLPCEIGRQILPGMHNMDGFYYARVKK